MDGSAKSRGRGTRGASARFNLQEQLNALARPRLVGSTGADRVTRHVRAALTGLGYDVREHPFQFNPWPGRLGLSVAGGLFLVGSLWAAALLYAGSGNGALVTLLLLLLLLGAGALPGRRLLDRSAWALRPGLNLLAAPPATRPKYLVLAHRDSKSQPVPLLFRGPAIALALLSWLCLLVLSLFSLIEPVAPGLVLVAALSAGLAGLVLTFCWVENNSPGALDNASGVAALLGLAEAQRAAGDVALLVTDAEELGLAGARAIARDLPNVIGAFNLDGLDDDGPFLVVERFGWPRRRGQAAHLAAALLRAGQELGLDLQRRDAPFGIMLDHMPIVDGGTPALTLMRGDVHSLRRVHRPADDLTQLRGSGVASTIELVGRALELLRAQEPVFPDR